VRGRARRTGESLRLWSYAQLTWASPDPAASQLPGRRAFLCAIIVAHSPFSCA
jgi:hypothetical protein